MAIRDPGLRLLAASGLASVLAFLPFAVISEVFPRLHFSIAAVAILLTWYYAFRWIGDRVCIHEECGRVGVAGDLLTVAGTQGSRSIKLNEVRAVDALKTDDLSIDTVWVRVWTSSGAVEFSEDFENFQQAMDSLVSKLPRARADWFESVIAKPPPDSQTLIWTRNSKQLSG